jgi:outer membrane protein assembly factor BamB
MELLADSRSRTLPMTVPPRKDLMKLLAPALITSLLLTTITLCPADDWPQWRGPNRDGKSSETGTIQNLEKTPPELLWMVEGMGRGYASVAVVDGRLYTTGNGNEGQKVVCIDAVTGEHLWSTTLTKGKPDHGYPGSRCTPSVDGDHLYVMTSNGAIACLNTDGEVVWQKSFDDEWNGKVMKNWGFSESPLVDGDAVLCTPGGPGAMVVKLNKHTGEEIWRSDASDVDGEAGQDAAGYSSMVVSNGGGVKQYVQLVGRGLIGIRASDGKVLWSYNRVANGTANIPTPIPIGDYVFASTGYRTGACLLKLEGVGQNDVAADEVYFLEPQTAQNHHGGMILDGDYIYFGHEHGQGFPTCLEWKTGKVLWRGEERTRPRRGSAAITYIDGQIIFRYQDGTLALVAATPEEYRLNGRFRPDYQEDKSWSHPVVVDGLLYLREQDKLMCYDFRASQGS